MLMLILNKKAHFFIPASNKNMKNHVLNIKENYRPTDPNF